MNLGPANVFAPIDQTAFVFGTNVGNRGSTSKRCGYQACQRTNFPVLDFGSWSIDPLITNFGSVSGEIMLGLMVNPNMMIQGIQRKPFTQMMNGGT